MNYELRDYQNRCLNNILNGVQKGVRLQVAVLATGLGKTVIFAHLPKYVKKAGKKTLVLAHREELLTQSKEKLVAISPHLRVDIEQAQQVAEPDADVIVASVATLGRTGSDRIKKFNPEHFGLIIIDECHHSVAQSYQNILSYFGANKKEGLRPGHPVVLGVTATPNRKDNKGLDELFDEIVFKYDIKDGIENGYLARIKAYTIFTEEDLNVKITAGDFAVGELADAINTEPRNKLIVHSYTEICKGDKALVFAADIEHARELRDCFRDGGYTAEYVSGETESEERAEILDRFKNGDLQVVVNCMVLTEGYDNPSIKAVLFARPTTSNGLYIQMAGRGTRLCPGKDHVKFLDFVDNCKKNSIISASTLIGLGEPIAASGQDLMNLKEPFEDLIANNPGEVLKNVDIDNIQARIEEVDIFKMAQLPNIVKDVSSNAWHAYVDGFKISLGTNEDSGAKTYGEIRENTLGQFDIDFYELMSVTPSYANGYKKNLKVLKQHNCVADKVQALKAADSMIREFYPGKTNLINQNANWRKEKPSDKQIKLLKKFGLKDPEKLEQLSKGEASTLLSHYFAKKSPRPV